MTNATGVERLQRFFWALALCLGFIQAWVSRFTLVNDTVSYLDIGDYIWRGNWSAAVNGLWMPFYPFVLGGSLALLHPTPLWEYPLVHLVLFIIFVGTLWCFAYFLKQLIFLRRETETKEEFSVPEWVWVTLGYTLFLWSSLRMIGVGETNPDMLIAAVVYLACALLLKMRRGVAGWRSYLALGATLGFGYLTKAVLFPIAATFIGFALFISLPQRGSARRIFVTVMAFIAIAAPFVTALSAAKGRLTFGESGRYNYAVHVNGVPPLHWQGLEPGSGTPRHPTRQLLQHPATYEFGSPLGGTYPPWYDPTFWYDGIQTRLELHKQLHTIKQLLHWEGNLFLDFNGTIVCGLFILYFVGNRKNLVLKDVSPYLVVLVPCVVALILYALVHVETRYVAPFVTILPLCLFFSVHLPAARDGNAFRLFPAVAVLMQLAFLSSVILSPRAFFAPLDWVVLEEEAVARQNFWHPFAVEPGSYQDAVGELYRAGLRSGDRIASLDCSLLGMSMLARLARLKIVAEVNYWPEKADAENNFWQADRDTQAAVIDALAGTGARAAISQQKPTGPGAAGWHQVGRTRYYIYWLG